jgi:hypothetical protein
MPEGLAEKEGIETLTVNIQCNSSEINTNSEEFEQM